VRSDPHRVGAHVRVVGSWIDVVLVCDGDPLDYGGADDDYFVVDSIDDAVVEYAGGGYDVVYATSSYALSDNIEQLILDGATGAVGWGNGQNNSLMGTLFNDTIYGLGGNDSISGRAGDDKITGGAGDDTMYGGSGKDTFRFFAGFGHDTIGDFRANGDDDVIEIDHNLFADFNAVQSHVAQNGNDVVITLDADNSITLNNVNAGQLTDLQFHFI